MKIGQDPEGIKLSGDYRHVKFQRSHFRVTSPPRKVHLDQLCSEQGTLWFVSPVPHLAKCWCAVTRLWVYFEMRFDASLTLCNQRFSTETCTAVPAQRQKHQVGWRCLKQSVNDVQTTLKSEVQKQSYGPVTLGKVTVMGVDPAPLYVTLAGQAVDFSYDYATKVILFSVFMTQQAHHSQERKCVLCLTLAT